MAPRANKNQYFNMKKIFYRHTHFLFPLVINLLRQKPTGSLVELIRYFYRDIQVN